MRHLVCVIWDMCVVQLNVFTHDHSMYSGISAAVLIFFTFMSHVTIPGRFHFSLWQLHPSRRSVSDPWPDVPLVNSASIPEWVARRK